MRYTNFHFIILLVYFRDQYNIIACHFSDESVRLEALEFIIDVLYNFEGKRFYYGFL